MLTKKLNLVYQQLQMNLGKIYLRVVTHELQHCRSSVRACQAAIELRLKICEDAQSKRGASMCHKV